MTRDFDRCLPIAYTMFVHVSKCEFLPPTRCTFAVETVFLKALLFLLKRHLYQYGMAEKFGKDWKSWRYITPLNFFSFAIHGCYENLVK